MIEIDLTTVNLERALAAAPNQCRVGLRVGRGSREFGAAHTARPTRCTYLQLPPRCYTQGPSTAPLPYRCVPKRAASLAAPSTIAGAAKAGATALGWRMGLSSGAGRFPEG